MTELAMTFGLRISGDGLSPDTRVISYLDKALYTILGGNQEPPQLGWYTPLPVRGETAQSHLAVRQSAVSSPETISTVRQPFAE